MKFSYHWLLLYHHCLLWWGSDLLLLLLVGWGLLLIRLHGRRSQKIFHRLFLSLLNKTQIEFISKMIPN